ncbi:hypothetical protein [Streptococcus chenjunshii]|uniref:hypothetical protein n=1 Tax=Streptococcus chenjunshii TaxID=2173853 RepID=UPI001F5443E1|nr:hypothetical protein [Streptococcus chenjunshii]
MIIILKAAGHYLFLIVLVSAWVFPLFEVEIYDNFDNKKTNTLLRPCSYDVGQNILAKQSSEVAIIRKE